MAYAFFLHHCLDLLVALLTLDILATCKDIVEAISFILLNQKITYDRKY